MWGKVEGLGVWSGAVLRDGVLASAPLILALSADLLEGWVWFLVGWYCSAGRLIANGVQQPRPAADGDTNLALEKRVPGECRTKGWQ